MLESGQEWKRLKNGCIFLQSIRKKSRKKISENFNPPQTTEKKCNCVTNSVKYIYSINYTVTLLFSESVTEAEKSVTEGE